MCTRIVGLTHFLDEERNTLRGLVIFLKANPSLKRWACDWNWSAPDCHSVHSLLCRAAGNHSNPCLKSHPKAALRGLGMTWRGWARPARTSHFTAMTWYPVDGTASDGDGVGPEEPAQRWPAFQEWIYTYRTVQEWTLKQFKKLLSLKKLNSRMVSHLAFMSG